MVLLIFSIFNVRLCRDEFLGYFYVLQRLILLGVLIDLGILRELVVDGFADFLGCFYVLQRLIV